jgi:hypothetical protein
MQQWCSEETKSFTKCPSSLGCGRRGGPAPRVRHVATSRRSDIHDKTCSSSRSKVTPIITYRMGKCRWRHRATHFRNFLQRSTCKRTKDIGSQIATLRLPPWSTTMIAVHLVAGGGGIRSFRFCQTTLFQSVSSYVYSWLGLCRTCSTMKGSFRAWRTRISTCTSLVCCCRCSFTCAQGVKMFV